MNSLIKELVRRIELVTRDVFRESSLVYYFTELITAYGVLVFNREGVIYHANTKYCQMHGFEIGELDGYTIYDKILLPEEWDYWKSFISNIDKTRIDPGIIYINTRHKLGHVIRKELFLNTIFNSEGVDTFVTVSKDISDEVDSVLLFKFYEGIYKSVFNLSDDALVVMFYDTGQIIDINKRAEEMYGYSKDELGFLSVMDITANPEKTLESIQKRDREIGKRLHKRKNGEIFPVSIRCEYLTIQNREIMFVKVKDESRMQADDELFSRVSQTIDLINDVVLQINPQTGVVTKANKYGKQVFGERAVGMKITTLLGNDRINTLIRRTCRTKKLHSVNSYITIGGGVKYYAIKAAPLLDDRNDLISCEMILTDKTVQSLEAMFHSANLSGKQRRILFLMSEGMGRKEIARALNIVPQTFDSYKRRLEKKLGMSVEEYIRRLKS